MVIVITGASSGIGFSIYKFFSKDKSNIVCSLSRSNKNNLQNFFKCDVTSYENVKECLSNIYNKFGKIDVLINNAGVGISGALELTPIEETKKVIDTNFYGTYFCLKEAIKYLNKNGKIINISSVCAFFPLPYRSVYSASKSAVNMLTLGLRMELENAGFQVTTICPGDTKSGFNNNRIKIASTNERYENGVSYSSKKIDKNYNKRMETDYVGCKIFKIINKKKLKPLYIIGCKYKLLYFVSKILPIKVVLNFTNKMFNKRSNNV